MSAPEHDPLCLYHIYAVGAWRICDRLRAARADERERAAERVAALTLRYAMEPGHVALATAAIRTP